MLRVPEGVLYSSTAAGLVAMVIGYKTPLQYLAVSWLAFAAILFGFRFRQEEFRYQAYFIGALGTGAGLILNALGITAFWRSSRLAIGLAPAGHLRGANWKS